MISDSSKHLSVTVSIFKGPHAPEFEFFWPRVCIQTALMPLMSLCPLSRYRKRRNNCLSIVRKADYGIHKEITLQIELKNIITVSNYYFFEVPHLRDLNSSLDQLN